MNEKSTQSDNLHKGLQRKRLALSSAPMRATLMLSLALSLGAIPSAVLANGLPAPGVLPNPSALQQQSKVAKGVVTDSNGEPLIGVSVTEKGTNNAYVTNVNGEFELRLSSANAQVVVSYVGFLPQTLRATTNMHIVLKEDSKALNEVVVVGYGAQKKANLTGAVSTVDLSKTMAGRPQQDVAKALQGAVPGLSVISNNGDINGKPTLRIRGVGTLSNEAKSNPLIVVDGVPMDDISFLNTQDIESVSVLKMPHFQ